MPLHIATSVRFCWTFAWFTGDHNGWNRSRRDGGRTTGNDFFFRQRFRFPFRFCLSALSIEDRQVSFWIFIFFFDFVRTSGLSIFLFFHDLFTPFGNISSLSTSWIPPLFQCVSCSLFQTWYALSVVYTLRIIIVTIGNIRLKSQLKFFCV